MIQNIRVDGFRSLLNTEIRLSPGLNVLVGANGTGKSNFIAFLDFVGTFAADDLQAAIAQAHGAGSVFSREKFMDAVVTLDFQIDGEVSRNGNVHYFGFTTDNSNSATYRYSASIAYTRKTPAVYIASESISISSQELGTITISRKTSPSDRDFVSDVRVDEARDDVRANLWRWMRGNQSTEVSTSDVAKFLHPEKSILRILSSETEMFSLAVADLTSYRSLNIDPGLARKSTPVGAAAPIQPTGEGLAGALYRLKKGEYTRATRVGPFTTATKDVSPSFESIVSWCKEVNPTIAGIDVRLDFMEAQFRPYVSFHFPEREHAFPFSRVSDGTVKWISLVTIVLAEPTLNIIEEPENFLHPFMQESFVAMCRQVIEADPHRTIVLSTHSPTLLDSCRPREITIFELDEGKTRASPVANATELAEKVERSRFGLGYYYRTGALYGADRGAR
jgi:predicted ATPase